VLFNRQEKVVVFLCVILIRQEKLLFLWGLYAISLVVVSDAYAGEE
jgi:hypothetical protein